MPPRLPPKTYILLLKTHKLTIFLTVPQATTIAALKDEALTALQSSVLTTLSPFEEDIDPDWAVPEVTDVNAFELCRKLREKGRQPVCYEALHDDATVKSSLMNWEMVFIQFKDKNGNLLPVKVKIPSLLDEEDDDEDMTSATRKGKRKAPPETES